MNKNRWTMRILEELCRLQSGSPDRPCPPVWLCDFAVSMLGNSNSEVGMEWDAALQELRTQGLISVGNSGYVLVTPQGRHLVERSRVKRELQTCRQP